MTISITIKQYPKQRPLTSEQVDGIVQAGLSAFGAGMTTEEIMDHINASDVVFVAYGPDEGSNPTPELDLSIIGFGCLTKHPGHLDLSGAALRPEYQGQGHYIPLTVSRIQHGLDNGYCRFSTKTQNPLVEKGLRSSLDILVKNGGFSSYAITREKLPKRYGRALTSTFRRSDNVEIDEAYLQLEREAGDAYLLKIDISSER